MASGVVTFDAAEFKTLYPQFGTVSDAVLTNYFNAACLLCDNTPRSLVVDLAERKDLLYLLTCHIATLKAEGADMLVGSLISAATGKVNIGLTPFKNANWYMTTQCGMLYWQATAKYRVGVRYIAFRPC